MQEMMKSTSKILAKLNEPEEQVPPTSNVEPAKPTHDDGEEYLTDRDLKKFRKKVERVLDEACLRVLDRKLLIS